MKATGEGAAVEDPNPTKVMFVGRVSVTTRFVAAFPVTEKANW